MMYPDSAKVLGSCGMPLARLAAESKTAQMKVGKEGMTVGRSWDRYTNFLLEKRRARSQPHWYTLCTYVDRSGGHFWRPSALLGLI